MRVRVTLMLDFVNEDLIHQHKKKKKIKNTCSYPVLLSQINQKMNHSRKLGFSPLLHQAATMHSAAEIPKAESLIQTTAQRYKRRKALKKESQRTGRE